MRDTNHATNPGNDSNNEVDRVRAACEALAAAGGDITFTAIAAKAGVSRATCYRRRELRAIIDGYRSLHGELLTLTGLADRIDNLTQALEAVASKVRRQDEELRALKQSAGPTPSRAARRSPPPVAD